jgi:hypothetical protein
MMGFSAELETLSPQTVTVKLESTVTPGHRDGVTATVCSDALPLSNLKIGTRAAPGPGLSGRGNLPRPSRTRDSDLNYYRVDYSVCDCCHCNHDAAVEL